MVITAESGDIVRADVRNSGGIELSLRARSIIQRW